MITDTIKAAMLCDFYGDLLTEHQKKCVELYYLEDLSLAEIAENLSVSRQAVHDIIKRSVTIMEDFEVKLQLIKEYNTNNEIIDKIYQEIDFVDRKINDKDISLDKAKKLLSKLKKGKDF